ncbi:MAG: hypothetical protein GY845_31560, partial [Planctomycetes bacterium]|nr:hypothetical protein [Planctomycetota bacterium]
MKKERYFGKLGSYLMICFLLLLLVTPATVEAQPAFDLTITLDGNGTTNPTAGIAHPYTESTVVPITATPEVGWVFAGWEGPVSNPGTPSTTTTMTSNINLIAHFAPEGGPPPGGPALTINNDGNGTTAPSTGTYPAQPGTTMAISAFPSMGYDFLAWTGDVDTIANVNAANTTITMSGTKSILATFAQSAPATYDLTMTVGGQGSTTPPQGISTQTAGATVGITATPGIGYTFVNWSGPVANPNAASTTVTMTGDLMVKANFLMEHDATISAQHDPTASASHDTTLSASGHDPIMSEQHDPTASASHDTTLSASGHDPIMSEPHDPTASDSHDPTMSEFGHDPIMSEQHDPTASDSHDAAMSSFGHDPIMSEQHGPTASDSHDAAMSAFGHDPIMSEQHDPTASDSHDATMSS